MSKIRVLKECKFMYLTIIKYNGKTYIAYEPTSEIKDFIDELKEFLESKGIKNYEFVSASSDIINRILSLCALTSK